MAERRFHEFRIDENYLVSFEKSVCRVEDFLLPAYRSVVKDRCLDGTAEQIAHLAMLVAFQYLRTRSRRDQFVEAERNLIEAMERSGDSIEDVEGYEPLDDNTLSRRHIRFMSEPLGEIAQIIGAKDFLLIEAPKGRRFYLSDNPVTVHNSQPQEGFYGNLGLSCEGIEIYMPLSSDLQLCAWCPSILAKMRKERAESNRKFAATLLSSGMVGVASSNLMAQQLKQLKKLTATLEDAHMRADKGIPISASSENMDFLNSLQVGQARAHLVCQRADFDLAKRFMSKYPEAKGRGISSP